MSQGTWVVVDRSEMPPKSGASTLQERGLNGEDDNDEDPDFVRG